MENLRAPSSKGDSGDGSGGGSAGDAKAEDTRVQVLGKGRGPVHMGLVQ